MIEAIQAGLTASALFLFAIMIVALVAFAAAPVMKEAWTKWRKRGKLDKVVSLVAVGIAIAYGGSKSHDVPNAGADDGIALVGISAEYDSTNDVTAVNVKYTAGDVTASTPVSVRNAESEQWRALEKIDATVTTGQTNVLAFAVAGNAATNRYWWVGVDTPPVVIESRGITITNYVATSKSVRIDWTCDDPKATVFAIQRRRKKPAGIPYDAEVEYLQSTGTQYIDTGVIPTSATRVQCAFSLTSVPSDTFAVAFGAFKSQSETSGFALFLNNTVPVQARTGGLGKPNIISAFSVAKDFNYEVYLAFNTLRVNGQSYSPSQNNTWTSLSSNMYIFSGSVAYESRGRIPGRFYYFKVWDGYVLIRDYIAVRRNGVGYMYDRVSKSLYGNAGTGAFAYGSDTLSYDWETVDTTSANTYTFSGFTIGEDREWRIMATYTEGDE